MTDTKNENSVWDGMAERYLSLTEPQRISAAELQIYVQQAQTWNHSNQAPKVLVMGATPDFYHMPWPQQTDLLAVDLSEAMLNRVWPGSSEQTCNQDWATMDLADASRDLVFCDCGFTFFAYPEALQKLAYNVARIMAPGGLLIVRLFLTAEHQESPEEVFELLEKGEIQGVGELKTRLWFAVKPKDSAGLRLDDVWRCLSTHYPDKEKFINRFSWSESAWQSIASYQGVNDIFYFPSVEQVTQAFADTGFGVSCKSVIEPTGSCSQHVRILTLRRAN